MRYFLGLCACVLLALSLGCSKHDYLSVEDISKHSPYDFNKASEILASYNSLGERGSNGAVFLLTDSDTYYREINKCLVEYNNSKSLKPLGGGDKRNIKELKVDKRLECSNSGTVENKYYDIRFYGGKYVFFRVFCWE